MYETSTLKEKLKLFIVIMIPILVTQVSMYLMNFFDTVMSARAGAADLSGVAICSSLWFPIFTGINGVLIAITPIIAHFIGAKANDAIPKTVQQAIYLATALAITILIIGWIILNLIFQIMDLEADVKHTAKFYLVSSSTRIIPVLIFKTLRSFIDSLRE